MGYKDKDKQREYQRNWIARRRTEYFADKKCSNCGSTERLELDHKDEDRKITHRIWSWSKVRRDEELAKCQVLCDICHKEKTDNYIAENFSGEDHPGAKLTWNEVDAIRSSYATREYSQRELARRYHVSLAMINSIILNKKWIKSP